MIKPYISKTQMKMLKKLWAISADSGVDVL